MNTFLAILGGLIIGLALGRAAARGDSVASERRSGDDRRQA
jgi:hypothetical protein